MAKRKSGLRYKNGQLKRATTRLARQAFDYGNDVVQAKRALFDCMAIKGGKAADQVHDGIGQLWALDFLDGQAHADDTLRDQGRLFAELWWSRYSATAPKISKYERASRTTNSHDGKSVRDYLFERMDEALPSGTMERAAVVDLCIDPWFFDEIALWAKRLVGTELLKRGRVPEMIQFETMNDRVMLDALIRGLTALVDAGSMKRRLAA